MICFPVRCMNSFMRTQLISAKFAVPCLWIGRLQIASLDNGEMWSLCRMDFRWERTISALKKHIFRDVFVMKFQLKGLKMNQIYQLYKNFIFLALGWHRKFNSLRYRSLRNNKLVILQYSRSPSDSTLSSRFHSTALTSLDRWFPTSGGSHVAIIHRGRPI